jgi:uncharacterized protein YukJ
VPLARYGVLAGRVVESRAEGGSDTPHFQIRVHADDNDFRVAVNVLSQQSPSELMYVADEAFRHPQVQALPGLPEGFTTVPSKSCRLPVLPRSPARRTRITSCGSPRLW